MYWKVFGCGQCLCVWLGLFNPMSCAMMFPSVSGFHSAPFLIWQWCGSFNIWNSEWQVLPFIHLMSPKCQKWYCKYNYLSISLITLLNKNNIESHSSIHHHIFHTWPTLAFAPPPFTDEPPTSSHLKVPFFKWSGLQDCCSGSGPRGEVGSHQTMFFKGLRALDCRFYKHWPKIKYHRNSGFYNICRVCGIGLKLRYWIVYGQSEFWLQR